MRSSAAVHNPLLKLPSAADLEKLPPEARAALRQLSLEACAAWRALGDECWKKNKPPLAAYWRAWSVNARHLARLCSRADRRATHREVSQ